MVESGVEGRWEWLASGNKCPPPPPANTAALLFQLLILDYLFHDLFDIAYLNQDILGLEVGMDNAALSMEVVESEENLLRNLLDERHGDATVVPTLNETEQIFAQDLEDHAYMGAVGTVVLEGIKEADDMSTAWMVGLRLDYFAEKLYLIDGRLGVMGSGSNNFEGDMFAVGGVP